MTSNDELRARLQVVVRSARQTEGLTGAVVRTIAGDLRALYVVDTDDDIIPLTRDQMEQLGLDEPHLHVQSVRNVIKQIQPIEREGDAGAWLLSEPGGLEESLMFVPAVWAWVSQWTDGPPVACMASRDVLLVTGKNDDGGLNRLRTAARAVYDEDPDRISLDLVYWDGTRWRGFVQSSQNS